MSEELLNRIAECFASVPKPAVITKRVARGIDDDSNLSSARLEELRAQDQESSWTELTDDDIEYFDDILPWLDPDGYRFYLPAFMSYTLRRYRDSASLAMNGTIYSCTNCVCSHTFALFTAAQMRCVVEFLEFCAVADEYLDAAHAAYAVDHLELNAPHA